MARPIAEAPTLEPSLPETYSRLSTETHDPAVLGLISATDAWHSLVLPLRYEGDLLVVATTEETFESAVALLRRTTDRPVRLLLAEMRPLEQFIAERYGFEGVPIEDAA